MSFNPDEYLASKTATRAPSQSLKDLPMTEPSYDGFNPDTYLQAKQAPQEAAKPQGSSLSDRYLTQLESFGNAVSLGYLPQIQAAFERFNFDPSGGLDDKLREQGFTVPSQDYVDLRDENLARQQGQAERNPLDSTIGTIAGAVASTPLITNGAKLLNGGKAALSGFGRLKDSASLGAALGLVTNPGDTEGVVSPMQSMERLKGAGTGALIGTAGQALGETVGAVGNAVKKAPETLDKIAKTKAFKAAGAMLKDFRSATGQNAPEEIGETLLKKGIVNAGDTLEAITEKTGVAKKETGQAIRNIYQKVNEFIHNGTGNLSQKEKRLLDITNLDGKKLADNVRAKLSNTFKNNLDNSEAKKRLLDVVENLEGMGSNIDLQDLLDARINLDESINYSKKIQDLPIVQQQMKLVRDTLHKAIQNRVRVVGRVVKDKELINQLKLANKEYGHLATVQKIAKDKVSRESANRFFSLGDRMTGGAAGLIGAATGDSPEDRVRNGLLGLVGGAAAGKVGRYSLPIVARSAEKLGKALQTPANFAKYGEPLIEAAKRSPAEFQALLNRFGKTPEFQTLYGK